MKGNYGQVKKILFSTDFNVQIYDFIISLYSQEISIVIFWGLPR